MLYRIAGFYIFQNQRELTWRKYYKLYVQICSIRNVCCCFFVIFFFVLLHCFNMYFINDCLSELWIRKKADRIRILPLSGSNFITFLFPEELKLVFDNGTRNYFVRSGSGVWKVGGYTNPEKGPDPQHYPQCTALNFRVRILTEIIVTIKAYQLSVT